jgi:hypothetical protein
MEYTEQKANEIGEKYNLPSATILTWKHRNKIPDKYFKEESLKTISASELKEFDKIIKAFSFDKLNRASIAESAKLDSARLSDLLRKKAKPHQSEFISIRKVINEVRNEVKNFLTEANKTRQIGSIAEKKFKEVIEDKRIVHFKVIDQNRQLWAKIDGWKRGARTTFPTEILEQVKTAFLIFLTETNIS